MFDEELVTSGLSELGYRRLKKGTYKASWSSVDVEHFLFFHQWDFGYYFSGDFGLRNPAAQQFALDCLRLFAPHPAATYKYPRYHCPMRFSVGRWFGWADRSSLIVPDMSAEALADRVKCDVRDFVLPFVRSVLSPDDLLAVLLGNEKPTPWFVTSGAVRAAKIVYLGRRLGLKTDELEAMLLPHLNDINGSIGRSATEDWARRYDFLEKVLHYANN